MRDLDYCSFDVASSSFFGVGLPLDDHDLLFHIIPFSFLEAEVIRLPALSPQLGSEHDWLIGVPLAIRPVDFGEGSIADA
jgi:hypothetical protein